MIKKPNIAVGPIERTGILKPESRSTGRDRRDAGRPMSRLAAAFDLQKRSNVVADAVAAVRAMKLPFKPQIDAMGDMWEVMKIGELAIGSKQMGALILDPTGCGKTTAAEAIAEILAETAEEGEVPVCHCRLPASGTTIGLYANALGKLGHSNGNGARESRLLTQLCEALEESKTKLLVIDEAQQGSDVTAGGQIAAAIKLILDAGVCPVAILGTEKAVGALNNDRELAGRMSAPSSLAPLDWYDDDDQAVWIELVGDLDAALVDDGVCKNRFGFDETGFARNLIDACNGVIGQLMGVTRTAVREMARDGRRNLTEGDIVYAIDAWSITYGFATHNPFRSED